MEIQNTVVIIFHAVTFTIDYPTIHVYNPLSLPVLP